MERYRITEEAGVYFVTFSVVDWLPVFVSETACRIITDSFEFCRQCKSMCVNAYVIMPTHLHAIVFDSSGNSKRLNQTLTDFRKFTGRQLTGLCLSSMPACFGVALETAAPDDRDHRFWQESRHPMAIETEGFWRQKLDYLHENPCRKGLVRKASDWRFSSAAWYVSDMASKCDIQITRLDWG